MSEVWKDIPGYEGMYQASTDGRIASLRRGFRVLKTNPHRWGHLQLRLSIDGKATTKSVHRLVALTFIGKPTGPLVRHVDGNPVNNAVENLAYGTSTDNNRDTVQHGHHWQTQKESCPLGHPYTSENTYWWRNSRYCRRCGVLRTQRYRESKREKAVTS